MTFLARDYAARHKISRRTRGPCDGLLAEIQRNVLARHPDWRDRLAAFEDAPFSIPDVNGHHRGMKPYVRRIAS